MLLRFLLSSSPLFFNVVAGRLVEILRLSDGGGWENEGINKPQDLEDHIRATKFLFAQSLHSNFLYQSLYPYLVPSSISINDSNISLAPVFSRALRTRCSSCCPRHRRSRQVALRPSLIKTFTETCRGVLDHSS
ncbi:hypothetical protein V8C43DRAFT_216075 [Trichoderma afarasin]